MKSESSSLWKSALKAGLIAGAISLLMCLVGMVVAFGETYIISGVFTLGDLLLLAPVILLTYSAARKVTLPSKGNLFLLGLITGLVNGAVLTALILIGQVVNLRAMFINASPELYNQLMSGQPLPFGALIPILRSLVASILAISIFLLPQRIRQAVIQAVMWVTILGVLKDQVLLISVAKLPPIRAFLKFFFADSGLSLIGSVILFILVGGLVYRNAGRVKVTPVRKTPAQQKRSRIVLIIGVLFVLLVLPPTLGIFFSEILDTTGLFILMGLGLNIVVGFAGLLDLGYVAFYAIGAYTMGVFTSSGLGLFSLTFWQALPIALLFSLLSGIILCLPVLRMRGDYLAIVTLGFGEIVRLLVLSDWLKPWLGGTQGIQSIAQPQIGPIVFDTIQELYYLILIAIAIVAFIAIRLKDSRLGRSWMAIREDEDVAQAMGIDLVITKLMAFASGALFAGLAGTLGAAKLTSVYPHSMTFIISINVLALIIIGGMGSIPGVFIGALVLMGLPGVLTEFAEFRWLFYGAALVFMMLTKPEGLWPEARRKLELHEEAEPFVEEELVSVSTPTD